MALTDNLIGYLRLEEASGNRADEFGSYSLTLTRILGNTGGKKGKAVAGPFSVVNYLSRSAFSFAGSFTFNLWLNFSSVASVQTVLQQYTNSSPNQGFRLYLETSGSTRLRWTVGGYTVDSPAISAGTTYKVTVTYSSSDNSIGIMLNDGGGGGYSTASRSGSLTLGSQPFQVGAGHGGNFDYGFIDELAIWNASLSPSDAITLYNSGTGTFYPFPVSLSNSVTFSDSANGSHLPKLTDTVTFTDRLNRQFDDSGSDTITFSDEGEGQYVHNRSLDDTVTFSDDCIGSPVYARSSVDTITFGQSVVGQAPYKETVSQTITFMDSLIAGTQIEKSVTDTIIFDDIPPPYKILLEDGSYLLDEEGDYVLTEGKLVNISMHEVEDDIFFSDSDTIIFDDIPPPYKILLEDGSYLLDEEGDYVLTEGKLVNISMHEVEDDIFFSDSVDERTHLDSAEHVITFSDSAVYRDVTLEHSLSHTLSYSDTHKVSPIVGNIIDVFTISDSAISNIKHDRLTDEIEFSDLAFRFNIHRPIVTTMLIFEQVVTTNFKLAPVADVLTFSDSAAYKLPYRVSLSDTLLFDGAVIESKPYRQSMMDSVIFDNTVGTNVKLLSVTDIVTFNHTHTVRNSFRQSIFDTFTPGHRLGEINIAKLTDTLIFNDTARSSFQIGETEDEFILWDEFGVRGTIYQSIDDELAFTHVLTYNNTLNLSVVDCWCLSDEAESVKYASLSDSIIFSDSATNHKWELLESTLTFEQDIEVEGIDFLAFPCATINQENPDADEEDNTLLGEDPFEDFELEFGDIGFGIGEAPDTSRRCGDALYLNYPNVEEELVFSDAVSPFGDRGSIFSDELGWSDSTVGFKLVTRR